MGAVARSYESFMAYRMMTLISRPFTEWPAFEMGLIDEKGKKIKEPKTSDEKDQFSKFMNIIRNIKKVINRVSGNMESKLGNLLIGAALLKEELEANSLINDPEFVVQELLESIQARYLKEMPIHESIESSERIVAGRYKLQSDFYDSCPVFYVKEDVQLHEQVIQLEDVLGRMYFVTYEQLTRI